MKNLILSMQIKNVSESISIPRTANHRSAQSTSEEYYTNVTNVIKTYISYNTHND